MRAKRRTPEEQAGGRIAGLAVAQHGVASRSQLRELGLSEGAIESGVRLGRLHRVHQGVYAVGYPGLTQQGRLMAATLASGPRAVLSHCCAAGLWRMYEDRSLTVVHVTLPYGAHGHSRSGIALHRSRSLPEAETTHRGAIPLTTPARTLMDLAASLSSRALERAVDEADRLGLAGHAELQAVAQAHRGHHGAARLATVLVSHQVGSTLTRSELEETFLAICRSHNLPQPQLNVRIARYTVDFLWAHEMLIVETDGYETHRLRRTFESDRERDARLTVLGYRTLRFTYRQVAGQPLVVANLVRSALRGP